MESTAPGAALERPGPAYGSVLLGDPPSFDEDDANPHCCVKPQGCSCRAVACGDRGVSCDMGRRPLVRRRWRCGSPFPVCQGMPPPAPRPPRSPRQSRLRSRTPVVPSCPVNVPKVSRGCRPAVFDAHAAGAYGPAHGASVDSPPSPEMRQRGQSVPAGASPRTSPECVTIPEAALGRRQPQATAAAPVPDSRRLSGCPVWPRWLPTHRPRAAPNGVSVPLAPRRHQNRMFSSLAAAALHADLAPRHYRIAAMVFTPRSGPATLCDTPGSDGARRLAPSAHGRREPAGTPEAARRAAVRNDRSAPVRARHPGRRTSCLRRRCR